MSSSARIGLLLAAVFAALYVPWVSVEPPRVGLESTRILVAREMQRSGDWIVPTQNGEVYLAKPPLWYWMIALGSIPFGEITVVSARLVAAACTLVLALCVAAFAAREMGARVSLLAGLSVLGSGIFLEKGLRAEVEVALALFTSIAILRLFSAVWSERGRGVLVLQAGLALGAALLVKGPVAWLAFVPALIGLTYGAADRRKVALACGAGALFVSIAVASAWLALLFTRVDPESSSRALIHEVFKRVYDPGTSNRGSLWFYGPALLAAFAPGSLMLPGLVSKKALAQAPDVRSQSLFALLVGWSAGTLVLLGFSAGKETRYLIATIPGWALLAAWAWHRTDATPWFARYRRVLVESGVVLGWVAPVALIVAALRLRPDAWRVVSVAASLVSMAAIAFHVSRRSDKRAWAWVALLLFILGGRIFWAGVPMAEKNERFPMERMCSEIAARLDPGEALVEVGLYHSQIQLLVDHPFRVVESTADLGSALTPASGARPARYVLASDDDPSTSFDPHFVEVATWTYGSSRQRLLRAP